MWPIGINKFAHLCCITRAEQAGFRGGCGPSKLNLNPHKKVCIFCIVASGEYSRTVGFNSKP